MAKVEKQKEKISELLELIKENPDLRIVPMVDTEVVASDDYGWWIAEWGKASVEEIYCDDERIYIRSNDEDTLIENLVWNDEFINGLSEEEAIKKAENEVKNYEWEKVVAVKIVI